MANLYSPEHEPKLDGTRTNMQPLDNLELCNPNFNPTPNLRAFEPKIGTPVTSARKCSNKFGLFYAFLVFYLEALMAYGRSSKTRILTYYDDTIITLRWLLQGYAPKKMKKTILLPLFIYQNACFPS